MEEFRLRKNKGDYRVYTKPVVEYQGQRINVILIYSLCLCALLIASYLAI